MPSIRSGMPASGELWLSMLEEGAKVILRERRANGLGLSDMVLAGIVYCAMQRTREEIEDAQSRPAA
jgi:hypothetical protein